MLPECLQFRAALLSAGLPHEPGPVGLASRHAELCAECSAWLEHAGRVARELEALPRREAPVELEGRVVAALEAGYRQTRAAGAVGALGRVQSPRELDEAVDADLVDADADTDGGDAARTAAEARSARLRAPAVLDRLVREELADPRQARARRYLGSLRRRRAPQELRLRVALALARRGSPGQESASGQEGAPGSQGVALRPTRPTLALAGLAAATLLVALGAFLSRPQADPRPRERAIVIERVADASELPEFAALLLDGASGGLLTAREM